MSSPSPAPPTENNEVMETVDGGEAPRPGHAESAGEAAAANTTVPPPHEVADSPADGGAEDGDMNDLYEEDLDEYDSAREDEYQPVNYVGLDYDDDMVDFQEEGGKFSESTEVEAMMEALWRKVVTLEDRPSAGHACSVCMEHLTCEGAHRICCIPCGHVYGRSCLEKWLRRNGDETAKCPQCGVLFADNQIINLYAPGNLWDGCGHLQEVKVYVTKAMAEVVVQSERQVKATRARASSTIAKMKAESLEVYAEVREAQDLMVKIKNEQIQWQKSLNATMKNVIACLELIKKRSFAPELSTAPPKLQDEDTAQHSQASRSIRPNKRIRSDE